MDGAGLCANTCLTVLSSSIDDMSRYLFRYRQLSKAQSRGEKKGEKKKVECTYLFNTTSNQNQMIRKKRGNLKERGVSKSPSYQ